MYIDTNFENKELQMHATNYEIFEMYNKQRKEMNIYMNKKHSNEDYEMHNT